MTMRAPLVVILGECWDCCLPVVPGMVGELAVMVVGPYWMVYSQSAH